MRRTVQMMTMMMMVGFGALGGCDDELPDGEGAATPENPPTLVAEVERADGTVRFLEVQPYGVVVTVSYPRGTTPPSLGGPHEHLSVEEQFRRVAPGVPIPDALRQAVERARLRDTDPTRPAEPNTADVPDSSFGGQSPAIAQGSGPVAERQSALTNPEYIANLCGFGNVAFQWCFAPAFQGAFATKKTHKSEAVVCSTTAATTFQLKKAGVVVLSTSVAPGACLKGFWHDGHNFLGIPYQGTIRWELPLAPAAAQFSGFFVDGDPGHINVPPGWN